MAYTKIYKNFKSLDYISLYMFTYAWNISGRIKKKMQQQSSHGGRRYAAGGELLFTVEFVPHAYTA